MADTDEKCGLTKTTTARLVQARAIANLLDRSIRVPGTNVRFGLDAILGLIPGAGDIAGGIFSGYLILLGWQMGMPASVLMRMVTNIAIDTMGGGVPVLGDLFDVIWKSNTRNLELLEQFSGTPPATPKPIVGKALVAGVLALVVLLIAGGIWLAVVVVKALIGLVT